MCIYIKSINQSEILNIHTCLFYMRVEGMSYLAKDSNSCKLGRADSAKRVKNSPRKKVEHYPGFELFLGQMS